MPTNKYIWTEAKFNRYIKESRGQGTGKEFLPWLMTYNVPSLGRRARDPGWKTGRLHHLLSDLDTYYFYLLEWSDPVIDIREKFPLLDVEAAQAIVFDMGIEYPKDKENKFPFVLTTDFMITIRDGDRIFNIVRTISRLKNWTKPK
jgi:hypothetical protein